MGIAFPSFLLLMNAVLADSTETPAAQWHSCKENSDCVLVEDHCGGATSNFISYTYTAAEIAQLRLHEAWHSFQWAALPWTKVGGVGIPLPLGYIPIGGISIAGHEGFKIPFLYSLVEGDYFGLGGPF